MSSGVAWATLATIFRQEFIDFFDIIDSGIEVTLNPFFIFLVFWMILIVQRFQKIVVSPYTTHVLWWACAFGFDT